MRVKCISLKHRATPSLSWSRLVMVPTKSNRHDTNFLQSTIDVHSNLSEF